MAGGGGAKKVDAKSSSSSSSLQDDIAAISKRLHARQLRLQAVQRIREHSLRVLRSSQHLTQGEFDNKYRQRSLDIFLNQARSLLADVPSDEQRKSKTDRSSPRPPPQRDRPTTPASLVTARAAWFARRRERERRLDTLQEEVQTLSSCSSLRGQDVDVGNDGSEGFLGEQRQAEGDGGGRDDRDARGAEVLRVDEAEQAADEGDRHQLREEARQGEEEETVEMEVEEEDEDEDEEVEDESSVGDEGAELLVAEDWRGGGEVRDRRVFYQDPEASDPMSEAEDYTSDLGDCVSSMTSTAWDEISTIFDEEEDQIAEEMRFLQREIELLKVEMEERGKSNDEVIAQSRIADLKFLNFSELDDSQERGKSEGRGAGENIEAGAEHRIGRSVGVQGEGEEERGTGRGGENEGEVLGEERDGVGRQGEMIVKDNDVNISLACSEDSWHAEGKGAVDIEEQDGELQDPGSKNSSKCDEEEEEEGGKASPSFKLTDGSSLGGDLAAMAHEDADRRRRSGVEVSGQDECGKGKQERKMNKFDILRRAKDRGWRLKTAYGKT